MKIFSKTLTENLPLKKPKNPKTIPSNMVCQGKDFNNDDILYIVEKVIKMLFNGNVFKNVVSNYYDQKPETIPSNLV